MKNIAEIKNNERLHIVEIGVDGGYAMAVLPGQKASVMIVFSWGCGWDHISVSYKHRCCTWEEMCFIKDLFFEPEECVVQYHPPKSEYVNNHPYALHLWRSQDLNILRPPKYLV